jgi:hypothetical protein
MGWDGKGRGGGKEGKGQWKEREGREGREWKGCEGRGGTGRSQPPLKNPRSAAGNVVLIVHSVMCFNSKSHYVA